jgi:hypothetical protein
MNRRIERAIMASESMTNMHQSAAPWEWQLGPASATRLVAVGRPRWLLVTSGRVWLTRSGAGPQGGDIWLEAGERHRLPAGSEWVAEGWPLARVAVLEAPVPARRLSALPRLRASLASANAAA